MPPVSKTYKKHENYEVLKRRRIRFGKIQSGIGGTLFLSAPVRPAHRLYGVLNYAINGSYPISNSDLLAGGMMSRVVRNRHFDDSQSRNLRDFSGNFRTKTKALLLQRDNAKQRSREKFQTRMYIS